MKFFRLRDLWWCGAIVIAYAVLFQVVIRTQVIEKVMASAFTWRELLLIAAFLITRILSFLLVPSVAMALLVGFLSRWIVDRFRSRDP